MVRQFLDLLFAKFSESCRSGEKSYMPLQISVRSFALPDERGVTVQLVSLKSEHDLNPERVHSTDRSNNFGGTGSASASAIAVGVIGNALAKATVPTTAGVTPGYSSADCF